MWHCIFTRVMIYHNLIYLKSENTKFRGENQCLSNLHNSWVLKNTVFLISIWDTKTLPRKVTWNFMHYLSWHYQSDSCESISYFECSCKYLSFDSVCSTLRESKTCLLPFLHMAQDNVYPWWPQFEYTPSFHCFIPHLSNVRSQSVDQLLFSLNKVI